MLERLTPTAIHPPFANYCHATVVPAHARWLYVSGQLGITADGIVPLEVEAQAELCFESLRVILAEADMAAADLVRLNTYLTDAEDLAAYMTVRDRYVADPAPASTLLVVKTLSRKQFKIEIEAIAAKVD
jgi:enamine deaminase RidA (YjgF/YER057c/UK114 family)